MVAEHLDESLEYRLVLPAWLVNPSLPAEHAPGGWGKWQPVIKTLNDLLTWAAGQVVTTKSVAQLGKCDWCGQYRFSKRGHQHRFCPEAKLIANLRMDPFERAEHDAIDFDHWYIEHMFVFAPAATYVGQWLQSFRDFPPRMKPGSFSLDRVMEAMTKADQRSN